MTEHVAGHETVKSLQMEPQLNARYGDYLATYLQSGFATKQIGNTYHVSASALEQLMTVLVLIFGAWIVMNPAPGGTAFTIGMLVAFQMFASRLSQPLLRMVGLWQQFQEASLAVQRLGDLMNVPVEKRGGRDDADGSENCIDSDHINGATATFRVHERRLLAGGGLAQHWGTSVRSPPAHL